MISLLRLVPPSKLELMNTDATVSVNAGTERQLSCRARDARPQAKIVWYQGDMKIVDQGRVLLFFLAAKQSLEPQMSVSE